MSVPFDLSMRPLPQLRRAVGDWWRRLTCTPSRRPVIVVGNQKSGTSAVAHLLADYGGLSKSVDIRALWPPTGVEVMKNRRSFHRVVAENPCPFSVELFKEPMMTFFLDQVVARFPQARFVFTVRDPRENIRSLFDRREIPGDVDALPESLFEEIHQGRIVVDPEVWGGHQLNHVGVAARRWNIAVDNYLPYAERVTVVRFEDFLDDKVATIDRTARRLGIRHRADISDRVDVQFQPRGNRDVSWIEFFGAENLRTIERLCSPRMQQFGYEPTLLE